MESWTSDNSDEEYVAVPKIARVPTRVPREIVADRPTDDGFQVESFDTLSVNPPRPSQSAKPSNVSSENVAERETRSAEQLLVLVKTDSTKNRPNFVSDFFSPLSTRSTLSHSLGFIVGFFSQEDMNRALEYNGKDSIEVREWVPGSKRHSYSHRETPWGHKPSDKKSFHSDSQDSKRRRKRGDDGHSHGSKPSRDGSGGRFNKHDRHHHEHVEVEQQQEEEEGGWKSARSTSNNNNNNNSSSHSKSHTSKPLPSSSSAVVQSQDSNGINVIDNNKTNNNNKKKKSSAGVSVVSVNSFDVLQDDA